MQINSSIVRLARSLVVVLVVAWPVERLCWAQEAVITAPETLEQVLEQEKALTTTATRVAEKIDIYMATWETWLAESTFKGDYTVVVSDDPQLAKGSLDRFREVTGPVIDRGRILKMREWVRLETSPPDPLKEVLVEDGKTGYVNIPSTSVTNGLIEIDHLFDPRIKPIQPLTEFVRVQRRTAGERIDTATNSTFGVLSPLTLGSPTMKLFELPPPRSSGEPRYEQRLVKYSEGVRGVSLIREDSDGVRITKSIRFDESFTPPRLAGVSMIIVAQDVKTKVDLHLDDYIKCGDHHVPRYATQQLSNSASSAVFVRQWKCLNLGQLEPNRSDFTIIVDQGVKIRGLKTLPKVVNGKRIIDPFQITDDLMYQGDYPVSKIIDPSAPPRYARESGITTTRKWFFWINIIGLAIIGWLVARRDWSKKR